MIPPKIKSTSKNSSPTKDKAATGNDAHAPQKNQQPFILWFTGLSGSGKTTLSREVDLALSNSGYHTYVLDGDSVRQGLSKDLGFSDADRSENIRRVAELAKLMTDAGLIVLVALISPFRADRALARTVAGDVKFIEVFMSTSLAVCEQRDVRGLYKKARRGEITNFTGIDSNYETPITPELNIDTSTLSAAACCAQVLRYLCNENLIVRAIG